ncbi:3-dehydroquinate synthase [Solemya velesiana gill symbiont]|uniref:3-dehydroquinate synthase n=1 Tax=Solemya velesiana gill symbiont TaxID=1918948 RepID=A0A1T2KYG5_9GAMM|nr:3-dehydroquinate synthase [Solemya velesiana gill symbiont]OOZ37851.1 3-dehydroquinate synthase [Solemya velesiana gill symbiont]
MSADTRILNVDLGVRSYPIYIGSGLLGDAEIYRRHIPGERVMVVTNETVGPLYLKQVLAALGDYQVETVVLPDGEKYKTLETWQRIFDGLLERRFDRQCTVLALGGGVVGDIAGFAAACYQRGVHFIQVPTTLLAQVDSSVGGKTGVNHPLGKNMIGAFYQPRCVIADTDSLNTLDDRQLSAGLAEVIKYGLISDLPFFEWLESNIERLLSREPEALIYAIERSCQDKADVVAADELEAGKRALLNLGHTFGHAIETGVGYGEWLHGEAVAAGVCMAGELSRRLGWLSAEKLYRIVELVSKANLPTVPPENIGRSQFLELMAVDKKVVSGKLRLVLMQGLGQSVITGDFDTAELQNTLDEYGR